MSRLLDRAREWRAVPWTRPPGRPSAAPGEVGSGERGAVAAALGLAAAGLAVPVGISVSPVLRGLIAPPVGAEILLVLLILAPAAVGLAAALIGLPRISASLRRNAPAEAEQAILRVFADTAVGAYALGSAAMAPAAGLAQVLPTVAALGLAAAWAVLLDVVLRPASSSMRWRYATVLDVVLLSAVLHFGGGPAAGWYAMYLAVVFYAGSRFGERALIETAALGVAGFSGMALSTEVWRQQPSLVAGLIAALLVLPACLVAAFRAAAAAQAAAARAEESRARSLAAIADALRSPLAMLRDPAKPATRRLAELIGDALDLAAIETGEFQVVIESFELRALAKEALRPLRGRGAEEGVSLRWRVDPRLPGSLRGPASAITRILGLLVGQLLDAAPEDGLRIAFDLIERGSDWLKLRIRINGAEPSGAADVLRGVADDQTTAAWEQQGLTVAIATRLVAMSGGELSIEGGPGPPNRFVVTLNLEVEPRVTEADLSLGGQPVLIASGEEAFAGGLKGVLDRWQADTRWVGDVETAEAEIAGLDALGGAVLIVDGRDHPLAAFAFAQRIRRTGAAAPFILFVGESSRIDRLVELDDMGLDCLLPLPLTERLLANAFRALPLEAPVPGDETHGSAAANADDDRVTPIAAHPKFVPDPVSVLDTRAIEALRAAGGGDAFLRELIDTFGAEIGELLNRVQQAVAGRDALAFSRALAALRRCAGHLGANRVCKTVPTSLTEAEFRERGASLVSRLSHEVGLLTAALQSLLPDSEARQS